MSVTNSFQALIIRVYQTERTRVIKIKRYQHESYVIKCFQNLISNLKFKLLIKHRPELPSSNKENQKAQPSHSGLNDVYVMWGAPSFHEVYFKM